MRMDGKLVHRSSLNVRPQLLLAPAYDAENGRFEQQNGIQGLPESEALLSAPCKEAVRVRGRCEWH